MAEYNWRSDSTSYFTRKKFTVRFYRQKLRDFYLASCVRHAYQLLAMIILFILFVIDLEIETDFENPFMCFISTFLIFLAIVHTIEFLRIALMNWISLRVFISQPYNRLLLTACLGYIVGTTVQYLMHFVVPRTYTLEQFSQICLVCAILFPFGKILRLLSIGKYIGPKLQMIMKMVSNWRDF
ncbi:unnamed protein product [Hymenolepis diminuta]|uniref:Ion_trans domain-containing protein n=1 Tax=Hymenolepis diminuta TaxID=6216 RepID=A0A0R3SNQ0_HYMDI|nr:unnamed protein product [Hymenolepis diminuta]